VIEGNRIAEVQTSDIPGPDMNPQRRPQNATREIDGTGMYVMPGFVDLHTHAGGPPKNPGADYAYKLWLAHGITTVRGVGLGPIRVQSERARAQRAQRDRRAAHRRIPARARQGGAAARSTRPNRHASGCATPPARASTA
jgi:predicted amidohydrolase